MAALVVDGFELVEVQQQHGEGLSAVQRRRTSLEVLVERGVVPQARHGIAPRPFRELTQRPNPQQTGRCLEGEHLEEWHCLHLQLLGSTRGDHQHPEVLAARPQGHDRQRRQPEALQLAVHRQRAALGSQRVERTPGTDPSVEHPEVGRRGLLQCRGEGTDAGHDHGPTLEVCLEQRGGGQPGDLDRGP